MASGVATRAAVPPGQIASSMPVVGSSRPVTRGRDVRERHRHHGRPLAGRTVPLLGYGLGFAGHHHDPHPLSVERADEPDGVSTGRVGQGDHFGPGRVCRRSRRRRPPPGHWLMHSLSLAWTASLHGTPVIPGRGQRLPPRRGGCHPTPCSSTRRAAGSVRADYLDGRCRLVGWYRGRDGELCTRRGHDDGGGRGLPVRAPGPLRAPCGQRGGTGFTGWLASTVQALARSVLSVPTTIGLVAAGFVALRTLKLCGTRS